MQIYVPGFSPHCWKHVSSFAFFLSSSRCLLTLSCADPRKLKDNPFLRLGGGRGVTSIKVPADKHTSYTLYFHQKMGHFYNWPPDKIPMPLSIKVRLASITVWYWKKRCLLFYGLIDTSDTFINRGNTLSIKVRLTSIIVWYWKKRCLFFHGLIDTSDTFINTVCTLSIKVRLTSITVWSWKKRCLFFHGMIYTSDTLNNRGRTSTITPWWSTYLIDYHYKRSLSSLPIWWNIYTK